MQLNPAHHLDHRLQEIDHQINSALRDIRRNMQELEKASTDSRPHATTGSRPNASAPKKDFSAVLQQTLESESDSAV
ncbi:MAG: hypothetical protein HOM68_29820 [Gemmatimonadetes bacterium]|jgi:hypothetical protein|nr:hypothetical protein [Gemmatimonadota bacterium]MBT4608609.1 hypothetical protein [Gemmatimonadota bacterium]MBT5060781.1 hypothetical protein [Gemmatimonadota bacterium]MBT5146845.1 hypothetical protein [Gemmatimonadota bacterium]MBT5590134.1 hypothetical protein [Gemmatimonadota bacterium]